MKKVSNSFGLVAIALLFVAMVLLNNVLFSKARIDLTEQGIYSISDGTKKLLSEVGEPINLYYFFSNKNTQGMTPIRNYASRVQSLLEEYALYSDGKVILHVIDPEPFSEAEDRATEFGLTAPQISAAGDSMYFGLAGTNALDARQIIPFFDPEKEAFLEYDISKMIYQLSSAEEMTVTLISNLDVAGSRDPATGQRTPAWSIFQQLTQLYHVEAVGIDEESLPEDTKVLMLVGPQGYSESLQYSIDQYVLKGGKVVVFVDPHAESGRQQDGHAHGANSSDLRRLLTAWGVEFDPSKVLLDAGLGLEVRMPSGTVGRHLGYIGMNAESISADDVTTADLQSINGASFGVLSKAEGATTKFTPLLASSAHTDLIESLMYVMQSRNPESLLKAFSTDDKVLALAARITGPSKSAFATPPEGIDASTMVKESDDIQVVVVADTDLLTDQFWVSQQNFFGSVVFSPFAHNGDFVTNIIENLGGSSALISVRGRGSYSRPFDVVQELTVQAETKFRQKEQDLETKLKATEQQLTDLQGQDKGEGALVLTAEQEAMVTSFITQRTAIRKELREVRHQLEQDIESLGSRLKFVTIVLSPLLLTLMLAFFARRYRRKAII